MDTVQKNYYRVCTCRGPPCKGFQQQHELYTAMFIASNIRRIIDLSK